MNSDHYDLIIVGAGPAGIFTALESLRINPSLSILMIEKGQSIENRKCPRRETGECVHCSVCSITTGFSGAGAFSDGKLLLSGEVGGMLADYSNEADLENVIRYVDDIYLSYGADKTVYGNEQNDVTEDLKRRSIESNIKFLQCPVRHIGTDRCYEIYECIQADLLTAGVKIIFSTRVNDIITDGKAVKGVIADKEYYSENVVIAAGRVGASWLKELCSRHGIESSVGGVDIGVRVEVRNEIMKDVNDFLYESKLIYYTPTFDDRVRTFCQNPSGIVATEYYDEGLAVVNGHSYKSDEYKTDNTNFAILVSNYFTDPFREPIEYGKYIARLGNLLSGDSIIVQRLGDFKRGRRTTTGRLYRNNIIPTLKDAVPGDLSLVLPYRIMLDIKEMVEALNRIFPGLDSDETLFYGVEVKFYSNIIKVDSKFMTGLQGLYTIGDGAGITRGLMQAGANGVLLARSINS